MAVFAEGVASADSPDAFPASANRAVFTNGFDKVRTARRRESTVASQEWADADLVHSHAADHQVGGNPDQPNNDGAHAESSRPSFLSSRWARRQIDRWIAA